MRTLEELKPVLVSVLEKYPVARAGVFGSYARGAQRADSDLDVLVEFEQEVGLFEYIELEMALAEALHLDVDLVDYEAIKPLIKKQVLKDEIRIYDRAATGVLVHQ